MAGISEPLPAPSMEELGARWSSAGRPAGELMEPALEDLVPPMTARNDGERWSSAGRAGELIMEPAPVPALKVAPVTAQKQHGCPLGSRNKPKPSLSAGRAGELIMEPAPAPAVEVAPLTARKQRGRPLGSKNKPKPPSSAGRVGELITEPAPAPALEVALVTARKRRGRLLGSKNKPKPPSPAGRVRELIMEPVPAPTLEVAPAAMRTAVLEVALGCDVVSAMAAFSCRHDMAVSVLSTCDAVAAVTQRQPAEAASAVTLRGLFEVLALYETVVPGWSDPMPAFSVFLAGAGGRSVFRTLAGEMTAADGGVSMVANIWSSAGLHWLPAAEDADTRGIGRDQGWISWHPHWQVVVGNGADMAGLGGQQLAPTVSPMHPRHRF